MTLQAQPLHSVVEPGFWSVFAKQKLEKFKLSDAAVSVRGWYGPSRSAHIPPQLRVRGQDLLDGATGDRPALGLFFPASGEVHNANTLEDFKNVDKKAKLEALGLALQESILSGSVDTDPSLLVQFSCLSFADLKRHKFLYWFCFPAIVDKRITQTNTCLADDVLELDASVWRALFPSGEDDHKPNELAFFGVLDGSTIISLADLLTTDDVHKRLTCLGMVDPGVNLDSAGWPVLNFGFWAAERFLAAKGVTTKTELPVLCVRQTQQTSLSLTLNIDFGALDRENVAYSGWEANAAGKMGPRIMDLSAQLDPEKLAQSACDLNLKLMRWRALPELDTEMIGEKRCLLVGSGTLGCAVARSLLGWGVRHITMLDNGTVSFSNPVRQSLYTFDDCKEGGQPKAIAAAKALRAILPGVFVDGVQLNIPMPGHMVSSPNEVKEALESAAKLEELIKEHDVVVLLTDTRESRWLPTLLGAKYDKIVLNAALGFDSFMVMRHGAGPPSATKATTESSDTAPSGTNRLGCYFCNDVVAPRNSMKDRTLDQQCTVTRPGLAPIAGALVVELLIGLLHHPDGNKAGIDAVEEVGLHKLGQLPHQIRGSLPGFEMTCVSGQAFPQCTACSSQVVKCYNDRGGEMLVDVFNQTSFLEDLTGLTALHESAALDELLLSDDFDDDDPFFNE